MIIEYIAIGYGIVCFCCYLFEIIDYLSRSPFELEEFNNLLVEYGYDIKETKT